MSSVLKAKTLATLVFFVLSLIMLLMIYLRKKAWKVKLRTVGPLQKLDELVGRATEMGRPVHFTTSSDKSIGSADSPQIYAGLNVLRYVADLTAKYGAKLLVSVGEPIMLPLSIDIYRQSYIRAGRAQDFNRDNVHFYADINAFEAGVTGVLMREKPALNMMIGPLGGEALFVAETGARVGAVQIGGTARTDQMAKAAVLCDYSLIGDEMFAASATLSQAPSELNRVVAQDVLKYVALGLILLGTLLVSFKNTLLIDLLKI